MHITSITDSTSRQAIARRILEALPDWFGIPEALEDYVRSCGETPFFCAYENDAPIGFLSLKPTSCATMELAVMGVCKPYHRKGIGRALFQAAKAYAKEAGFCFMQVKTVQMGKYADYDATNRFYLSLGFVEFEVFPTLWDEANPCQIYVMSL